MYNQAYKYKFVITLNCIHHVSLLMDTLTFNTCQFLHWNYVPRHQYQGSLLCIFVLFFKLYFYLSVVVGILLTLASCIGDPYLLTILAYIKNYNPKLLVIIIIIVITWFFCVHHTYLTAQYQWLAAVSSHQHLLCPG